MLIQAALQRNLTPAGRLRETDRAEVYVNERWMRGGKGVGDNTRCIDRILLSVVPKNPIKTLKMKVKHAW